MHSLAALCLRRPFAALALLLGLTIVFAVGAARLRSEAGYRAFLGSGHPAVRELDAFAERFGGGLPFAAVWSCGESPACEDALDAASLEMAARVAASVQALPGVRRVDSPATSPLLVPEFGVPTVRRLVAAGAPARDLHELRAFALSDPMWVGQILSADGSAGALVVHLASSDASRGAEALKAFREQLAPHEARGFRFHLVGGPVEFVVAGAELEQRSARLVPVMVALVGLVLLVSFRALAPALVALASVGLAVLWTLGLQGWIGWPRNSFSQTLAPLVLVIGVCDAIHVLAGYAERLAPGADRAERERVLLAVVRRVGPPCVMTTLTTAAGFASFAVSGLESLARFGAVAAFGVCAALFSCFSLLPVLTVRVPAPRVASADSTRRWGAVLGWIAATTRRRAAALLTAAAVAAGLGALGATRLEVEASFEDLYGRDSQVVRWVRAAAALLRDAETLEVALEPGDGQRWDDAAAFGLLARVEELEHLDGLGRPLSVLAPIRGLHRVLHSAPLELDGSPESGERARSMLRLIALEDSSLLDLFVDREGGALRVSFQAGKLPQAELRALLAEARRRLDAALPEGWTARLTGPLATVAVMIDEIRRTQLQSFAVAALLVWALVALFFRSIAAALLSIVPTGLPVLVTIGAMGLAGIALDVGSAMVAAVVLGLAVDNAIHVLAAWRRQRQAGAAADRAMTAAVAEVGRALTTTSLALCVGFSALALAPWRSIASFGLISAVAILGALLAALFILPAGLSLTARLRRAADESPPALP